MLLMMMMMMMMMMIAHILFQDVMEY